MNYIVCKVACLPEYVDILMAELAEISFESFMESSEGFEAYMPEHQFDQDVLDRVLDRYAAQTPISVVHNLLPRINWNEEWEKNYDPIKVGNRVFVRASFHPKQPDFEHEIIINPKMSFGTGHHATTHMMLELLLDIEVTGTSVLDVGSGTGILAIMARKLGATSVEAFDIDDWCVENGNENFGMNGMSELTMGLGTIADVDPKGPFDLVLANINKNVLLSEMDHYARLLKPTGLLLVSGIYDADVVDLTEKAQSLSLRVGHQKTKNNWAAVAFHAEG